MMASAALAAFLSLCLFFATGAQAWLVTSYYEQSLDVFTDNYYDSTDAYYLQTYTNLIPVKPTITGFEPISMETSINSNSQLTVVDVLVPTGVASTITGYDEDYYSRSSTTYYVDITMSANPTRCTDDASWVWKTAYPITIPYGVTPSPTSTSTSVYRYGLSTYTSAYLNPTDVPVEFLSSRSSSFSYYSSWIGESCTVPYYESTGLVSLNGRAYDAKATVSATARASATTTSDVRNPYASYCARIPRSSSIDANGRYTDSDYGWGYYEWCDTNYNCACRRGLPWWGIIPVIWGSWIFLCLLVGMIESWFRFRNLCLGRSARRGLPIAWTLIFMPWTCFFLCCLKRGYTRKSPEEQTLLKTQWQEMGFGKKLGRWLKWGFRYKYPTFLGPAPFRRTKWEEKDIAAQLEANRRSSVNAAPMAQRHGPMANPVVGQTAESYYKPQAPAQAYMAPGVGVATDDFAQGDTTNRGIGRNRQSELPSVSEGPPLTLPARPESAVSPVSRINPEQEALAEPTLKSPKVGRGREDLRGNPVVGV